MMARIDRGRGCTIRMHRSGFRVVMYKDQPGVYLDERGEEVSDKVAAQAGYDVESLRRERLKRKRMADYQAQVEEEFSTEQEDTERLLSVPSDGLNVKHIGGGRYAIVDDEGGRLTQKPLTKEEAQILIDDLKSGGEENGS